MKAIPNVIDAQTILVTGGASGIGAVICQAFLDAGHRVVMLDRDPPSRPHERLHAIEVDLLDAEKTKQVAERIGREFKIGCLVHNAGLIRPSLVENVDPLDLQALTQLHLVTPLVLLQAVLPAMKATGQGRVVLISSRAALGVVTRTAYSATKAGMIGMARTWALELAPAGVTVNVVAPGPIGSTRMFETLVPPGSELEGIVANAIPMRRLGTPEDVANAVTFFASPASGFITGQVLYVCGGASVGVSPI